MCCPDSSSSNLLEIKTIQEMTLDFMASFLFLLELRHRQKCIWRGKEEENRSSALRAIEISSPSFGGWVVA